MWFSCPTYTKNLELYLTCSLVILTYCCCLFVFQPAMTNSKSSGDNGFESSDGWEVEDEVEIPNGNGEADNNNMEANFEAICDTARYVLLSTS